MTFAMPNPSGDQKQHWPAMSFSGRCCQSRCRSSALPAACHQIWGPAWDLQVLLQNLQELDLLGAGPTSWMRSLVSARIFVRWNRIPADSKAGIHRRQTAGKMGLGRLALKTDQTTGTEEQIWIFCAPQRGTPPTSLFVPGPLFAGLPFANLRLPLEKPCGRLPGIRNTDTKPPLPADVNPPPPKPRLASGGPP